MCTSRVMQVYMQDISTWSFINQYVLSEAHLWSAKSDGRSGNLL